MNQILKDLVYSLGTRQDVDFIADEGGLDDEERKILHMWHERKTDLAAQEEVGMSHKAYKSMEDLIRVKVALAVFHCIEYTKQNEKR